MIKMKLSSCVVSQFKNAGLLVLSLLLAFLASPIWGILFRYYSGDQSIVLGYIGFAGLPLSCSFFVTLLLSSFGWEGKIWWIAISLLPSLAFVYAFGYFSYSLFFLFATALGIVLGLLLRKIISKLKAKKVKA